MKAPAELLAELSSILFDIENDDLAVRQYGDMFAVLTSLPDIQGGAMEGMNRVSHLLCDHGKQLGAAHERMREIVKRLANP